MKTKKTASCRYLCITFVIFASVFLGLSRGHSQTPAVKLITLRATVKDIIGHPVSNAIIIVTDKNKAIIENPDAIARFSGWTGKTYTQVPTASSAYFVTVHIQGYLSPPTQKISGLRDANLIFLVKRKPPTHPKNKSTKRQ